jgi:hypothetical protein
LVPALPLLSKTWPRCPPRYQSRQVVGEREAGRAVQVDLDGFDVAQRVRRPGQRVAEPPLDVGDVAGPNARNQVRAN